jgi:hypothetical protein
LTEAARPTTCRGVAPGEAGPGYRRVSIERNRAFAATSRRAENYARANHHLPSIHPRQDRPQNLQPAPEPAPPLVALLPLPLTSSKCASKSR